MGVLQTLLLLFVFTSETPIVLKERQQYEKLRLFLAKIYHPYAVQEKIDEIQEDGAGNGGMLDNQEEEDKGYSTVFCSPKFKKATWLGCALSIGQQTTGINFIMFYSNTLFGSSLGMPAQQVTGLIGIVNFVTTFGGLILLSVMGRRTIMVSCGFLIAVDMVLVGLFIQYNMPYCAVVATMSFIALFEFSYGPVTWLYLAETMQDKAISVATMLNSSVGMIISIITPYLISLIGEENIGYIFIACGGLTLLNFILTSMFMIETRGKTPA